VQPTSQVPLNVSLQYLGVKSNQAGSGEANIYLLLVITDGYEQETGRLLPAQGTFSLQGYQTIELNQEVFHTGSRGDSLKVCILAYKQNDPSWRTTILMPALAEIERSLRWGDYPSAKEILSTVDKHMEKATTSFSGGGDQLIGYYENVWGAGGSFGVGQYEGVGSDDLRLWFSIWSKEPPGLPLRPALLPDVSLQDVNIVSTVSTGDKRVDIIRIQNDEPHPISVVLKGTSLLTGEFYNSNIDLPADGFGWLEKEFGNNSPGTDTISYYLYFRGIELDSWSEELAVVPDQRRITLVEWRNSDGSTRNRENAGWDAGNPLY